MLEKNLPFLLSPSYKGYLWGGSKLRDEYGKESDLDTFAESWECSTHKDGQSVVASGVYRGIRLGDVLSLHPEFLGSHPLKIMVGEDKPLNYDGLPILIKLIDAKSDLSIQVHPTDEYAYEHEGGQLGKTEMWYVLHADRGARIVYGLRKNLSLDEMKTALSNGSVSKYLQYVPVKKDDVFFVEAGTIHAIGEGAVIAEIQENSNLTYRLYDYDRTDKNGKTRELHIDKALDVANLESSMEPRQPMRVLMYRNGYGTEFLGRCKYFQVERMILNTERYKEMADYKTGSNSFKVLLCTDGCGTLFGNRVMLNFFKGDTIFVPANSIPLKLHGRAQLLDISC